MSWGLLFGTMITLFAIPALYVIFYDVRSIFCKTDKFRHACPDMQELNRCRSGSARTQGQK